VEIMVENKEEVAVAGATVVVAVKGINPINLFDHKLFFMI
jgi:hypothetical protein